MHGQGFNKYSPSIIPEYFSAVLLLEAERLLWSNSSPLRFSFPNFSLYAGINHAVFTKKCGVGERHSGGFNLSFEAGEEESLVIDRLHKVRKTTRSSSLVLMKQTHSDLVEVLSQVPEGTLVQFECDAIISPIKGVGLLVRTADCQAVLIYDPKAKAVAAVHCGWRGAVKNILAKVIGKMVKEFDSDPEHIKVAIGPSLGPCCSEFKGYMKIFPEGFREFMVRDNYFDMWAVSCWQLIEAGVKEENIEISALCTKCNTHLFYSYRGEKAPGRFGASIGLC
ncbi:MAG TPA: peptidoglycan editing factor PgeF [Desulfobacterales bacterium]|nr:peptidoglycan editing factor PgeF [Desulfobacterales bacterium]